MLRAAISAARARTPSPPQHDLGAAGFGDGEDGGACGEEALGARLCDTKSSDAKRQKTAEPDDLEGRCDSDDAASACGSSSSSLNPGPSRAYMLRRLPSSPSGRCAQAESAWESRPLVFPSLAWWVTPFRLALAPFYERQMARGLARPFELDSHSIGTWMENIVWRAVDLPAHDGRSCLSEPNTAMRAFVSKAHAGYYGCFFKTMKNQGTSLGHCLGHGTAHTELRCMRPSDALTGGTMCTPFTILRGNRRQCPPHKHPEYILTFGDNRGTLQQLAEASHEGSIIELLQINRAKGGILEQTFAFGCQDANTPEEFASHADRFVEKLKNMYYFEPDESGQLVKRYMFTAVHILKLDPSIWLKIDRPRLRQATCTHTYKAFVS